MTDMEILGAAIAYTNRCIAGAGGLKGANCTIKSIDPITGGNRITFEWEDNEGHIETSTMDVMDGADGQDGVSPTISVSTITGGHVVSITDAQGTNTFNIMNGIDGSDGKDGKDGTNGTNGTDGVGITSITFKGTDASGNNVYTVNLSNSTSYDITCPKGPAGATGSTGPAGPGVASGGTTGQVLKKKSGTDYDTEWADESGGSYVLPTATASRLGGVKIGSGINVEEDGTISASGGGTDDYNDLDNQPQINGVILSGNKTTSDLGINIPTSLADLDGDSTHRLVTDTEKATWNGKSDFSGAYADLTGLPTLGTASAKNVPASGDASSSEVVLGNDSRLTDSRPASDVSSWAKQATKPTYTASEVGAIPSTDKGANGGVAELDSNGKVPSSQLPSYVDDVLSYASQSAFPATGETGKIYIAEDTNKTYRWSGSVYAEISESLALGETSSTAYRGDRGKTAYAHSQTTGNPHGTTASQVMLSDGVTSVDDALNGFKFYPTGTSIVGLVSDDSPYTDVNGNYVLANSPTGQSMIDDVTYKSINSSEDTRGMVGADTATPFKSGVKLMDINPNKAYTGSEFYVYTTYGTAGAAILVQGYSKLYLRTDAKNANYSLRYPDASAAGITGSFTSSSWVEVEIPSNVAIAFITSKSSGDQSVVTYFSLKA